MQQSDGGGRVVRMHITVGFTIIYILHINLELSSARIISVRAPTTWMEKEMKRKKRRRKEILTIYCKPSNLYQARYT